MFPKSFTRLTFMAPGLLAALLLTACGGGGGCGNDCGASTGDAYPIANPDLNTLPPSSGYANICTAEPWLAEKSFVLTYMNENYLLYNAMVPPIYESVPVLVGSVEDYFYALLSNFPTSGNLPSTHPFDDHYSYAIPTYLANSLDSGYSPGGYGFSWVTDRNGNQRVAYVQPGSRAASANMKRGGVLSGGFGAGAMNHPYTANGMYPYTVNGSATFSYQDPGSAARSITLNAAPFQEDPVPVVASFTSVPGHKVGYVLFLNHSSISQDRLIKEFTTNPNLQGITDLVLDLRYNEGGFVYAAQSLASMIAGSGVKGRTFEQQTYNGKVPNVTLPFTSTVTWVPGISSLPGGYNSNANKAIYPIGTALPALNLKRVYVLTSDLTASASESLINALRGVDVSVVQIGTLTYGKPYGSNRRDNCGEAFFPIQYQGFNDKGFGDYGGGFTPTCLVHDDFNNPLGNPNEALLNAALGYVATGQCPGTISQ